MGLIRIIAVRVSGDVWLESMVILFAYRTMNGGEACMLFNIASQLMIIWAYEKRKRSML